MKINFSTSITQQNLAAKGFSRFEWNAGTIIEYWKSLWPDGRFDYRLGVRFGEHPQEPVTVYIFLPSAAYRINWFSTVEQIIDLYKLLLKPGE